MMIFFLLINSFSKFISFLFLFFSNSILEERRPSGSFLDWLSEIFISNLKWMIKMYGVEKLFGRYEEVPRIFPEVFILQKKITEKIFHGLSPDYPPFLGNAIFSLYRKAFLRVPRERYYCRKEAEVIGGLELRDKRKWRELITMRGSEARPSSM